MRGVAAAADRHPFRRVVLALDTASGDPRVLDQVAALAARLRGDLLALFVEDIEPGAAGRPPARVHLQHPERRCPGTGGGLSADQPAAADAASVPGDGGGCRAAPDQGRVQLRQGRLMTEVREAAGGDDLVVISWSAPGWSASGRVAPWEGSTPPPAAVVQVDRGALGAAAASAPRRGPAPVAFDGSEVLARAGDGDTGGRRGRWADRGGAAGGRVALADAWAREDPTKVG